jgi:phage antirepressor YoqD-like protein
MSEVSQILKEEYSLMYGRNQIFQRLRQADVLNLKNLPYQQYVSGGYFTVAKSERNGFETLTTLVRPKGMKLIVNLLLAKRSGNIGTRCT